MVPFLRKFFPLEKSGDAKTNMYCMYDSQALTSFTSFLYIAGLAASLVASRITAKFGRKFTMVLSGCTILLGAAVNGASQNIAMLIIGCILLGFGVGFTNQSIGFGSDSALIAAIILAFLFLSIHPEDHSGRSSSSNNSWFRWSWGPLSWLVPSEIFPLNIRPTGQSISVAVNFATTFVLSQTFLSMLCCFKFGAFFFYAGWIVIKTIFIALFLPETKGIPLDSMHIVWNQHWYWHKFVKQEP
uniref:Major facilitator superfamily (MFS) profile domain-containing protein n=1 Tax=Chenopodium quinoa TaxID=63459 RepID=A0A803N0N1_CHEQI